MQNTLRQEMIIMRSYILLISLVFCFKAGAQIPSTRETIQHFIDSVGESDDPKTVISSAQYPLQTDGTNYKWKLKIWRNSKKELLWVEYILPDGITTVYFYCKDSLIFVSELTYASKKKGKEKEPLFRNIYINGSTILDDTAPGRNKRTITYYLEESANYRELAKSADE